MVQSLLQPLCKLFLWDPRAALLLQVLAPVGKGGGAAEAAAGSGALQRPPLPAMHVRASQAHPSTLQAHIGLSKCFTVTALGWQLQCCTCAHELYAAGTGAPQPHGPALDCPPLPPPPPPRSARSPLGAHLLQLLCPQYLPLRSLQPCPGLHAHKGRASGVGCRLTGFGTERTGLNACKRRGRPWALLQPMTGRACASTAHVPHAAWTGGATASQHGLLALCSTAPAAGPSQLTLVPTHHAHSHPSNTPSGPTLHMQRAFCIPHLPLQALRRTCSPP